MKQHVLSSLIVFSMILSPALKADDPSGEITTQTQTQTSSESDPTQKGSSLDDMTPLAVDPVTDDLPEEQGTPVGQASNEGAKTAKRKQWQNITIAACAVAVAVVALILVSSNHGHKKK